MGDGAAELARMVDRTAIVDLTIAYCWALDSGDWQGLRGVFTDGATARLGATDHNGADEIVDRCRTALAALDASQHMVTNHVVTFDDGPDRATCRCYFQAQHVREGAVDGSNYLVAGRYDDHVVRGPDGWRIERRVLTALWTDGNPAVPYGD